MKKFFLFVNYTPYDKSIGITKKIFSEIRSLRNMQYEVFYSAYTKTGVAIYDNNDQIIIKHDYLLPNLEKKLRRFYLIALCNRYLKGETFDYCLLRWDAFDQLYLTMLKRMKRGGATILMETLSYFPGMKFAKSLGGYYLKYYTDKNSSIASRYIDLALTEGKLEDVWGVPAVEFGMGVDTQEIIPHVYVGEKDEYHIISVANETGYHGYDRLLNSLEAYYKSNGKKKIFIHLVGVMFDTTIELSKNELISEYVILCGKKTGKELDDIYSKCNIAAGPLAQFRAGGKKDTGLKTKEYFARGIPYFYAGVEDEELENFPYIYQISDDESLIDFDEIISFYETIKDKEIVSSMRNYALQQYSWEKKFLKVFDKLDTIV